VPYALDHDLMQARGRAGRTTTTTPDHAWNDFLNPEDRLDAMDFRGVLLSRWDCLQATIPRIRARWVRRIRPMPMPRDARRQILRDPYLRPLLIPPKSTAH
jgi:hypothetical protein